MALRRSKDEKNSPQAGGVATAEPGGASVEECVALGQALVDGGHLPGEQLAASLSEAEGDLWKYGNLLLTKYGVGRAEYAQALGTACGLPVADTRSGDIDKELGEHVPEKVARKFYFIPVAESGGNVTVWAADCSKARRDAAESEAGKRFEWVATDPKTVTSYMEQIWRPDADIDRLVAAFQESDQANQAAEEAINEISLDDQAPVVQLVSRVVGQALRDRASDIHIEPLDKDVRVRFRIDGQLVEAVKLPISRPTIRSSAGSRSCRR